MRAIQQQRNTAWPVVAGVAVVGALTAFMVPFRDDITRASPALVLVVPIVLAGLVGGRIAALVAAVTAATAFNLAFIPPYWTFDIHAVDDVITLVVFGFVAVVVGTLVVREGERRHSAEERALELQQLNSDLQSLQQEREQLAEEATRAAVLERVDEQRSALLRSVSHDLRTPLAAIRAVATDLLGGISYDDATRTELLTLVADEADRLDRLVANLLSLSRIEAAALRPDIKPMAIDDLVNQTISRLTRLFEGRKLQVEVPAQLALVRGDYVQLGQVLTNLLENAARHAPPRSFVRIGAREVGDTVEVYVADDGAGVGLFERDRIFEPFRSGDGSSSSGIGLAICKAIIEAHGGRIWVDSSAGAGSRFTFTVAKA